MRQTTVGPETRKLAYMPQLDALRAFAVAAVLVHHYLKNGWAVGAFVGVKFFFALSGFLITGILLKSRAAAEAEGRRLWGVLGRFYARRSLRIFPLYYLVVAVALAIDLHPAREISPWLLTYTVNILMSAQGWFVAHFAHFWTLAVEGQFYLFWPWLVLLLPRKWLVPMTLLVIAIGPFSRLYAIVVMESQLGALISTPACLDTLGMGSLLAIVLELGYPRETVQRWLNRLVLPMCIAAAGVGIGVSCLLVDWRVGALLADLALGLVFCWLICRASLGFGGRTRALLEWQPLVYVGKISYGIYVYHPFMPSVCSLAYAVNCTRRGSQGTEVPRNAPVPSAGRPRVRLG